MTRSSLWRLLAPLVAAAAWHGAAQAGAGDLVTTVTRLQPNVTYSDPTTTPALSTYVGYTVSIANAGGNTINNIRFTGATAVTEPAEQAVFASIEGTTVCTVGAGGTSIDCNFGQLRAGTAVPSFTVFFKAPARATTLAPGVEGSCASTDCVGFSGITYYAEGTGGLNSPPDNSISEWGPVYVTLGTDNPVFVKSAVQKAGGTLFTGKGGVPIVDLVNNDPFATTVTVPAAAAYTTAQIDEATITGDAATCNGVLQAACYRSTLAVPGTFSPYLAITLRLDATAIPNGTKIGSLLLSYRADGSTTDVILGACANATTPRTDGIPCIASSRAYPKNSRSGRDFPVALEGDFEWTLINTHNGSIKIF